MTIDVRFAASKNLNKFESVGLKSAISRATITEGCMAKAVGFILALVALVAGILSAVDPATCLWRAGVAFFIGWMGSTIWQGIFAATSRIKFIADNSPHSISAVSTTD